MHRQTYTYHELFETLLRAQSVIEKQDKLIAKKDEMIDILKELIALNDRELAATHATIMQPSLN